MLYNSKLTRMLIVLIPPFDAFKNQYHYQQAPKEIATPTSIFMSRQEPIIIKDLEGRKWTANLTKIPSSLKESGATEQSKITLTNESGATKLARVKQIDTLNEAITYYNITQNKENPLSSFMPQFITVLDKGGNLINLSEELEKCDGSIEKLCKKEEFQPAFIVMRDLVNEIDAKGEKTVLGNKIKDFKMVMPSLQGTNMENKLHGYKSEGFIFRIIRRLFFSLSGCSFAFQKSTKSSWYSVVINNIKRMITVGKTKKALQKEFEKLPKEQLESMKNHLINLRSSMLNSGYAFSDASLLFLPSKQLENGIQVNALDIRLIDMSHALAKSEILEKIDLSNKYLEKYEEGSFFHNTHTEILTKLNKNLDEYNVMVSDMDNSLKEMEAMIAEIIVKKSNAISEK